jgi:hypothetical protein
LTSSLSVKGLLSKPPTETGNLPKTSPCYLWQRTGSVWGIFGVVERNNCGRHQQRWADRCDTRIHRSLRLLLDYRYITFGTCVSYASVCGAIHLGHDHARQRLWADHLFLGGMLKLDSCYSINELYMWYVLSISQHYMRSVRQLIYEQLVNVCVQMYAVFDQLLWLENFSVLDIYV